MNTIEAPSHVTVETTDVDGRRLSKRFLLPDTAKEDSYGETETAALDITVSHNKDRKRYEVRFYRVLVGPRFVRWAMELRNEDPQPVTDYVAEHAPRFSAKKLAEVYVEALARHEEDIPALLDWATRAKR